MENSSIWKSCKSIRPQPHESLKIYERLQIHPFVPGKNLDIFHTAGAKLGVIFYKTFTKVSEKCSHCLQQVANLRYGQQNRATCFITLLDKLVESYVARFTMFRPVREQSCLNTDFWLDKIRRESRHTPELRHLLCKRSLTWAGKTRNMYRFCRKK